jgi:hypothetical protein
MNIIHRDLKVISTYSKLFLILSLKISYMLPEIKNQLSKSQILVLLDLFKANWQLLPVEHQDMLPLRLLKPKVMAKKWTTGVSESYSIYCIYNKNTKHIKTFIGYVASLHFMKKTTKNFLI